MSKYAKRVERIARTLLLGIAASGRSPSIVIAVLALMLVTMAIEIYEDYYEVRTDQSPNS